MTAFLWNDEELKQLRKEWNEKMDEPWLPFNHNEYLDYEEYKKKIKEKLKASR